MVRAKEEERWGVVDRSTQMDMHVFGWLPVVARQEDQAGGPKSSLSRL